MPLYHLNAKKFHRAIIYGCESLITQREELNAINVFPVADGDTGDNMASTAKAIITYSSSHPSFEELLRSIADASIIGAHGNSGIIFSAFFNALTEKPMLKEDIDINDFATLMLQAAISVRNSLAVPVDGTILTMIEELSRTLMTNKENITCFNVMMEQVMSILKKTLAQTTNTLLILKKSHVVDAGALGFFYFIKGFAYFLTQTSTVEKPVTHLSMHPFEHHDITCDTLPLHRYCTEAVLKGESIDKTKLAQLLENEGNSIAITGNDRICRFHTHTNNPCNIFSKLIEIATVDYPKVDDMVRQFEVIHQRKQKIALVTDSSADIPLSLRDKYQIHLIPVNIHLDEHNLLDRYSFEPDYFYQKLLKFKTHPKTSFPSPALIEEKLHLLSKNYDHVLVISVSKELSGTFNAIHKAAQNYNNITVVNSRVNSGGQGLLLLYAAELIEAGNTLQFILQALENAINNTYIFVMVNEFESMIRSGRVSRLVGRIGQFSKIKPIISFDKEGKGIIYSKAFNADNALTKIIKIVKNIDIDSPSKLAEYCIVHAGTQEKAEAFARLTTHAFQKPPAYIEPVSTAIGIHAGQGCIALAARLKD